MRFQFFLCFCSSVIDFAFCHRVWLKKVLIFSSSSGLSRSIPVSGLFSRAVCVSVADVMRAELSNM